MSGTDYGQAFALWREAAAGRWRDYSRHAVIGGLRHGSLPFGFWGMSLRGP